MDEWHEQAAGGEAHAEEYEVVQVNLVAVPQLHAQEGLLVHHHHHEEAVHTLDGPHPHPVQSSEKVHAKERPKSSDSKRNPPSWRHG